jgi:hypothetical protein
MMQEMSKKEVRLKVAEMLSAGEKKRDVFAALSGRGVKDRALAYFIASHVDPQRCAQNKVHRGIVIALGYLQVLLAVCVAIYLASETSVTVGLAFGAVVLAFAGLFVWGFTKNIAGVYNTFLILSITQAPRQLEGFSENPTATVVGLAIGVAIYAYVWFVRQRLFPDFAFMSPKKAGGRYVFAD